MTLLHFHSLAGQFFRHGSGFFGYGGVLLNNLVQLHDGGIDLVGSRAAAVNGSRNYKAVLRMYARGDGVIHS